MSPPKPKARVTLEKAWQPPPPPSKIPLPPVFPHRWACAYGEDEFGLWQAFEVKGVRQVLRWIPPGEFWMGSPENELERRSNETCHQVTLTQGFWLADTACTQALWAAVLGENPSRFKGNSAHPVEQVSWMDVKEKFLSVLNRLVPGLEAELPFEAQWEYACRAGVRTPFWFGEQITPEQVNYNGDFPYAGGQMGKNRRRTVPVKSLPANGWGLYEMQGNVCEWCEDVLGEYPIKAVVDPRGHQGGFGEPERVLRGGSWYRSGRLCRSASRLAGRQDARNVDFGFRLAQGVD